MGMAGKQRVLLSYTSDLGLFPDQRPFAQIVREAILTHGADVMDRVPLVGETLSEDRCRRQVRECDIFVGLVGFRLRATVSGLLERSYLELEFDEAIALGKPKLLFLLDDSTPIPRRLIDVDGRAVEAFRERIRGMGAVSKTFSSPSDVTDAILSSLATLRFSQGEPAPGKRPWMSPAVMTHVIERPEISAPLLKSLVSPESNVVGISTVIEGAGGFGKTTLVAHICRDGRVGERFPGGLLWATVGEGTADVALAKRINGLCGALTGEEPTTSDPMLAGARLGTLLDAREPTLLVIDDVWRASQLAPFLIGGRSTRRLVTTRIRDVIPPDAYSITVDEMSREQAVQALTVNVGGVPRRKIERLLELTGRWPVLLGIANASLVECIKSGASAEHAIEWLARRLESDGPTALDVDDAKSRNHAVSATVQASLALLSPDEQERYFDLAIFPEDCDIPADVLRLLWGATGRMSVGATDRLRDKVVRLRLAIDRWHGPMPALRLHDTIRSYVRHHVTAAGLLRRNTSLVNAAANLLGDQLPDSTESLSWWKLPSNALYLWNYLTYHMQQAGMLRELEDLVCDLRWAEAKINVLGTAVAVDADLALVDSAVATLLRRALGRAAAMLTPLDPTPALAATIVSRLGNIPELASLVERYKATLQGVRLENLWPWPDQPDSALLRTLQAHGDWVRSCAFSPDGSVLATTSNDRGVRLWRVTSGELIQTMIGHREPVSACAFSPDGTLIATTSFDRTARLWDVETGLCVATSSAHTNWVRRCSFSSDGELLATVGDDRRVEIWHTKTGEHQTFRGHRAPVLSCEFAPTEAILATTAADGEIRIWDVSSGTELLRVLDAAGPVVSCSFSQDGGLLATAGHDRSVRLWRTADGTLAHTIAGHAGPISDCAFSPDGMMLATASFDSVVRIFHAGTWQSRARLVGHGGPVTKCAFSPDGSLLATSSVDQTVNVWDMARASDQEPSMGHTDWVRGCAFSPDGVLLATVSDDQTARIWRVDTGQLHATLIGHNSWVASCTFSPDGAYVATGSFDTTVWLWRTSDGSLVRVLAECGSPVTDCAFSYDGALLGITNADGSVAVVETLGGGRRDFRGSAGCISRCAFSPDGTLLATVGDDRVTRVWATGNGQCLTAIRVAEPLSGCTWHPRNAVICAVGRAGVYMFTVAP